MSHRWETALDAQLDAFKFYTTGFGSKYIESFANGTQAKDRPFESDIEAGYLIESAAAVPNLLYNAEPIWVEPDMMTLWEAASDGFVVEPIHPSDFVTDVGFVYLPRPHLITDKTGERVSIRAIGWMPIHGKQDNARAVQLVLFHQIGDTDHYSETEDWLVTEREIPPKSLLCVHYQPWLYEDDYEGMSGSATNVLRDVQCLLRLMQQTITTKERGRASKPFRRRWQRADVPERNVVVVRLRRPKTKPHEDSEAKHIEWDHRWMVKGHWRWQPYPTEGIQRQIFISPYVKGPEDKPLRVSNKRVFDWGQ